MLRLLFTNSTLKCSSLPFLRFNQQAAKENSNTHARYWLSKLHLKYHVPGTCKAIDCIQTAIIESPKLSNQRILGTQCAARRRVRYDVEEEDDNEEDGDEEYGHKEEITMLELYSQSTRGEALIVHAMVDEEEVEVLIFKGFSSCLSGRTPTDPSRSVIPARAVIKSIDIIKGPFDPSNTEYIRKGLTWEAFKSSLLAT